MDRDCFGAQGAPRNDRANLIGICSKTLRRIECPYRRQGAVEPLDLDDRQLPGAALRQFRCARVAR
jgi:hypothetical protein